MFKTIQAIQTPQAPKAIGPYSQAVSLNLTQSNQALNQSLNQLVFLSGQIPLDPEMGELITGDFKERVRQVFKNLEAVCQAAGAVDLNKIVKLTIFLTDLSNINFQILNQVMQEFFTAPYPARSTIQVAGLPKGTDIEIEGILAL